ncbi:MAG: ABC transporter ATP-binding protein [Saprospirales bacterium]|nr:MAG: ABC transporter ATP-binding protein [Saprospirales bacterium]
MRSFLRLVGLLRNYKLPLALHVFCNLLMAIFTIFSLPAIIPFFQLFLNQELSQAVMPDEAMALSNADEWIKYYFLSFLSDMDRNRAMLVMCGVIVLLFFLKNLFHYLAMFFLAPIRNGIVHDLRAMLFAKILNMPVSYYDDKNKGDLLSRFSMDVMEVESSVLKSLEKAVREPLLVLGSLGFMLYLSPRLTLFVFVLIFITAVIIGGISQQLKKKSKIVQETLGKLLSFVDETVSGIKVVKAFRAENFLTDRFSTVNSHYKYVLNRVLWRRDLSSPLSEFLGITVVCVLFYYGAQAVYSGEISSEAFLAFLLAFFYIINPSKSFANAFYSIQKGLAALQRVEDIVLSDVEMLESANPVSINTIDKGIEVKNAFFEYNGADKAAIDDVSFFIPAGTTTALVGRSGSGKSTLTDLIARYYDLQKGEIRYDDIDVRNLKIDDLRKIMAVVSQEPVLFNDTIYNNIVFGLEACTKEQVIDAAKKANAHDFIMETPNGYESGVGDRGNLLSGGQKQRIALARAILRDPPLLVLDEATSALDSASEKLVQKALEKVMKGRTSIVVAHRLSTIMNADQIVVLDEGRVVETGTHKELMENKGEYYKFINLQSLSDSDSL